jgi:hypothetical protein
MDAVSQPGFFHRRNVDRSWDCICLKCYLTVITTKNETDLAEPEEKRDCDDLFALNAKTPFICCRPRIDDRHRDNSDAHCV